MRLLVLADDLTGAADAGSQAARHRVPAALLPAPEDDPARLPTEAVIVNTATRHAPAGTDRPRFDLPACCYLKFDSTLRGRIGSELEWLVERTGRPAIFAPAYPAVGRVTRGGVHFVDGLPVSQTAFGRDALAPVGESHLPTLLARQTRTPVESVRIERLERALSGGPRIVVVDAERDADLAAIAAIVHRTRPEPLCAGAAALLDALLPGWPLRRAPLPAPPPLRPLLVIAGSLHPVSLAQARAGLAAGFAVADDRAAARLLNGESLLLQPGGPGGPGDPRVAERLAARAAAIVADLAAAGRRCGLCCFGGETSAAVLRALRMTGPLTPAGELEPGVNLLAVRDHATIGGVVLKCGGFGGEDLLARLAGSGA